MCFKCDFRDPKEVILFLNFQERDVIKKSKAIKE